MLSLFFFFSFFLFHHIECISFALNVLVLLRQAAYQIFYAKSVNYSYDTIESFGLTFFTFLSYKMLQGPLS